MIGYQQLDDRILVNRIQQKRDHQAFAVLYERHWEGLVAHAYALLRDADDATDVVQEVFTAIWKRKTEFDLTHSFANYIHSAARHGALKILEKRKKLAQLAAELKAVYDGVYDGERYAEAQELAARAQEAIERLSPRLREIYRKSRHEGLPNKRIAEELGISENTVKSALNRALNILRSELMLVFLLFFN